MRASWRWAGALLVAGAVWTACDKGGATRPSDNDGKEQPHEEQPPPPPPPPDPPDAGAPDAGEPDAGTPDAGEPDAGTPDAGEPDAGTPDAGPPVINLPLPTTPGWQFFGPQQGGPRFVFGVTADQGGNIWVAGGEEGLFLLKSGESTLRRFTMADGLRPYGRMRDGVGGPPPGTPYLKVISVAGGPSGTVFVGYAGKPPAPGMPSCEDEWDQADNEGRPADPSVYKSGDADKVTLLSNGTLRVVHYDIHTGPTKVPNELRGREKLCTIHRIAYDARRQKVWFGGNHGFAMGEANFDGNVPSWCYDPRDWHTSGFKWDRNCVGLFEHVHPAINGANDELLTDRYAGVAVASNGDVFFGGEVRSTRFLYGTNGENYWAAMSQTEDRSPSEYMRNRFDLWPDAVDETRYPRRDQRVDDSVSGIAVMPDGTIWVSSYNWGLAHVRASPDVISQGYHVISRVKEDLINYWSRRPQYAHTSSIAADPLDNSIWAGAHYGGGITRLRGGSVEKYGMNVFGDLVHEQSVWDIQVDRSHGKRRMLVAFGGVARTQKLPDGTTVVTGIVPGAIGIYSGD
ncbi:hypothetical protein P2318_06430 [Myxococcaceae bacterium GXIMD 01537]